MNLLQPWVLFALPVIALPVIIHLIHRRRHRVVEWGAMMFLLAGAKMSKGAQNLRNILILTLRTLAVAGLVIGVGRPIAGGWLGSLGGDRPDAVVVLLDRSASMQAHDAGGEARLTAGARRIARALELVDANDWAVVDSVTHELTRLDRPGDMLELSVSRPTAGTTDLPAMLEQAVGFLEASGAGRAEIWICSDGQSGDWRVDDGRWTALNAALLALPAGVRVHFLNYGEPDPSNLGVRVERVRRVGSGEDTALSMDIRVTRALPTEEALRVPISIVIAGGRSVVEVELRGREAQVLGHRIPIDPSRATGWGRVELTPDGNPADDTCYFVFGEEPVRDTLVVAERDTTADVMRITSQVPVDRSLQYQGRQVTPGELLQTDLAGVSLIVWQAQIPAGELADALLDFVARGGRLLCLPPEEPGGRTLHGLGWGGWLPSSMPDASHAPNTWRGDDDLLAHGSDGTALPVGDLFLPERCAITGEGIPLATMGDGQVLLMRAATERGGVYFLGALPEPPSNLIDQGVVLVALVHRAIAAAETGTSAEAHQDAGLHAWVTEDWKLASAAPEGQLLAERSLHAGVLTDSERLVAINRPLGEDAVERIDAQRIASLFDGLDVLQVDVSAAGDGGLVEEIWRMFLIAMLLALLGEALLCIHERSAPRPPRRELREGMSSGEAA